MKHLRINNSEIKSLQSSSKSKLTSHGAEATTMYHDISTKRKNIWTMKDLDHKVNTVSNQGKAKQQHQSVHNCSISRLAAKSEGIPCHQAHSSNYKMDSF